MKRCMILLGLMLLVASCAGLKPQRPAGFENYRTVAVEVLPDAPLHDEQARALQAMLVEALEQRQVFPSVRTGAHDDAGAGLIIQVRITRLIKVPDVQRIAVGRMAGSNEISADIAAIDGTTRQVLSSFRLKGESPDYPPGFDWPWGSIETAMERLTKRLVRVLLDWKQGTDIEH